MPGGGDVAFREDGVIVLDNTFPHYVYNDCSTDRFVLMTVRAQEQKPPKIHSVGIVSL